MRRTKIVATIGPASRSPEVLERLIRAGVDVVRLNFSHGTHEQHLEVIQRVRAIAARLERSVALLQDLSGPKIRTGKVRGGEIELRDGARLAITTDEAVEGTPELIATTYDPLPRDVQAGDTILLDDGNLELRVLASAGQRVECEVVHGGTLKSNKGMNLPGVSLSTPALTEKDRRDLAFGLAQGVDYVALSFVRQAADVAECKALIAAAGARTPVIAKIEKREAVNDLAGVLEVTDGVMVARGDLGVELSTEEVPTLQKRIIQMANGAGKVVITATQMLESMIDAHGPPGPRPPTWPTPSSTAPTPSCSRPRPPRGASPRRRSRPWPASRATPSSTTACAVRSAWWGRARSWRAAWPGWRPRWPRSWTAG